MIVFHPPSARFVRAATALALAATGLSVNFAADRAAAVTATTVLGTNAVLSTATGLSAPFKNGTQVPVARSGSISGVTIYVDGKNARSGSQQIQAAIYSDSNNAPAAALGTSAPQTVLAGQAAGWLSLPLSSAVTANAGSKIWLVVYSPSGSGAGIPVIRTYGDNAPGFISIYSRASLFGTTTASFTGRYSLYATETYSSTPAALSTWQAALASRNTAPAKWLAIGESLTEGQGASTVSRRWLDLTTQKLRSAYPTSQGAVGGENYVPATYWVNAPDSPWGQPWVQPSGSPLRTYAVSDLGHRTVEFDAGSGATYPLTGDSADIWYDARADGGTFSYQVDGGAVVNVSTTSSVSHTDSRVMNVSLGAPGAHSVTVREVSGPIFLEGFSVFNGDRNSGVQMYDSGLCGATVASFLQDLPGFTQAATAVAPKLVTVELGGNDYFQQTDPATFKAQFQQLVSALKALPSAPSIELIIPYTISPWQVWTNPWSTYQQQIQSIADADPAHVTALNLSATMPVADTSGTGLYRTDGIHPNDSGQSVIAGTVFSSLTQ